MKKYSFKLESILEYKKSIEEMTIKELALVMAQLEKEKERLKNILAHYEDIIDGFDVNGDRSPTEIVLYSNYIKGIKEDIKKAEDAVDIFTRKWEEKQADVVKAAIERKSIETLKTKELDRYNLEMTRFEQSLIDEVAGNTYIRRQKKVV